MPVPVSMLLERLLEIQEGDAVAVLIPVHQAVAAHRYVREDERPERYVRLDRTAGAYPQDVERAVLRLLLAGVEIHVGEGVELRHHYVDVVRAYACGEHGETLAFILSRDPDEFPGSTITLDRIEQRLEHRHPARVPYEYDIVCKLFRTDVYVERRAVRIDNQF